MMGKMCRKGKEQLTAQHHDLSNMVLINYYGLVMYGCQWNWMTQIEG